MDGDLGRTNLPLTLAVAVTRALGGIGAGLLLADRMDRDTRRAVGAGLLAGGIASTMPLLWHVIRHAPPCEPAPD